MFLTFRTHLIYWPFASNAMSGMTQQLLLHYQIPQLKFGLQLHPRCVPYGRLLFAWDITITSALDCMSRTDQSSSSHRCLYRHHLVKKGMAAVCGRKFRKSCASPLDKFLDPLLCLPLFLLCLINYKR